MRRDPLAVGVDIVADALKISPWVWLSLLAAFGIFVGTFQVVRTRLAQPTPTWSRPDALSFIQFSAADWGCARGPNGMAFTGQVTNTHPTETMLMVKLRASLYDQADRFVATEVGFVQAEALPPNTAARFAILVADPDRRGTACKLKVEEAVYR